MNSIEITAEDLVNRLLQISTNENVCMLDSGGVDHQNSHLFLAGIRPVEVIEICDETADSSLQTLDQKLSRSDLAAIFTISYDFGLKLENILKRTKDYSVSEPDIFIALFDCLIIHDYQTGKTRFEGDLKRTQEIASLILNSKPLPDDPGSKPPKITSNFSEADYVERVNKVLEYIRSGDTYQTNITQQFRAQLDKRLTPQHVFKRLRNAHPAPFSAFLTREKDHVVSISPERLISISDEIITASPIKGTRKRGNSLTDDERLRNELLTSEKDRAENTMIVDLLRNDIGRICEFGSVKVESLCKIEEHPTIFHLVSTISGILRNDLNYSEIIRAVFPCGSITGCPKIRTMGIIDELETAARGLSMGTIGYRAFDQKLDLNVAIRTMVIKEGNAVFNVGGGIVIDSDPSSEYFESLLKAKAMIAALSGN